VGGACNTHGEMMNSSENQKGINHSGNLKIYGRIILKLTLNTGYEGVDWI
jgi:hypothetical protein